MYFITFLVKNIINRLPISVECFDMALLTVSYMPDPFFYKRRKNVVVDF